MYPAKTDGENIYISIRGAGSSGGSAEILFSGKAQPGSTASDVNIEEVSFSITFALKLMIIPIRCFIFHEMISALLIYFALLHS